jgi:hypothetical protein
LAAKSPRDNPARFTPPRRISTDLPDGQISAAPAICLSSASVKNILIFRSRDSVYIPSIPPHKGAFRDRHERWCGMRWTRAVPLTNGAGAGGEVVWS